MSHSITKRHGVETTQVEMEKLAAAAGCKPDELVFKSNDGEGTYTISAPEGGTRSPRTPTGNAIDAAAAARRAAGLD
jgi:hypothetical protein